jgi:hypothetical protein
VFDSLKIRLMKQKRGEGPLKQEMRAALAAEKKTEDILFYNQPKTIT